MKDAAQEQLAATRRNQILDAATRVFAAKGFHPTTIKDIAREAGIADGTIYIYFKNKNALLIAMMERMSDTARNDIDVSQLLQSDFRTFMATYLRQPLIALKRQNFELFGVVMSELIVNKELRDLYEQKILQPTLMMGEMVFQHWASEHALTPDQIRLTVRLISSMMMGLMLQHILGDSYLEAHWEELPDFLTDLVLNGLMPRP
jgi:TetR/AcrR family fatty acid metabolism transcriptional regulator